MKMNAKDLADLVKDVAGKVFEERAADMRADVKRHKESAEQKEAALPQPLSQIGAELKVASSPAEMGIGAVKFLMCLHQAGNDTTSALHRAHARGDKSMTLAFEKSIAQTKALETSPLADGGALIPTEYAKEIIEFLRSRSVVLKMGANQIPMPSGSLTLGKQTGTSSLAYLGESENYTATQPSFGDIVLSAKKAGGIVPITEELINDSSFAVMQLIRDDLFAALAVLNDQTMLRSAGGEHKPTGLRYQIDAASVLTATQAGSASTVAEKTYDLARVMQAVLDSNVPGTRNGWVMSNREYVHLSTLVDANNNRVHPDMAKGIFMGFPFAYSSHVPVNLGAGDESEIYFGDWSQMIIGETGGVQFKSMPGAAYHDGSSVVSSFSKDQVPVKIRLRNDMKLRHNNAFAVLTGVDWGGVAPV